MANLDRRVQVLFDPEQYARLETEAMRRHTSVGGFIRDSVEAQLRTSRADREVAWTFLQQRAALGIGKVPVDQEELQAMKDSYYDLSAFEASPA